MQGERTAARRTLPTRDTLRSTPARESGAPERGLLPTAGRRAGGLAIACCNSYILSMNSRLQAEIKQNRPFRRLETEAMAGVLRTAAVLDHTLGEALKPFGVTLTQYNVLRILRGAGERGLCGRDVGERLISRVPDVPRLLDRMEEMAMIHRERDPSDRRHVTARITADGVRVLEEVTPVLEQIEEDRFSHLGADALRSLIRALDTVRAAE
jgi:MarR family transcriptional regulator, organic hydroperoxide resistance regulator